MEAVLGLFVFCLAVAIIYKLFVAFALACRRLELRIALGRVRNFSATWRITGVDSKTLLALDQQDSTVVLVDGLGARRFTHQDILSTEIVEDGNSITRTDRLSQAGGALVGAALLGPVGLLAGAVTGKRITGGKVKTLELHLIVDDPSAPSFLLCLLNTEMDKSHPRYRTALEWARAWQGRIELLIRKADRENPSGAPLREYGSISAEISRLAELKSAGALTDAEFQQAKQKLLGQTGSTQFIEVH